MGRPGAWTSRSCSPGSCPPRSPGWLAIGLLLRYLRTHSTGIFIAYRLVAAVVFVVLIVATR